MLQQRVSKLYVEDVVERGIDSRVEKDESFGEEQVPNVHELVVLFLEAVVDEQHAIR